jgi:hypothetical protein
MPWAVLSLRFDLDRLAGLAAVSSGERRLRERRAQTLATRVALVDERARLCSQRHPGSRLERALRVREIDDLLAVLSPSPSRSAP